ncbi:MAG TPA: hypothetical protein VFU15_17660, partial [Bacteroidia bacterium]|nr:hypothetical protein [Bacteroidia bacterium]
MKPIDPQRAAASLEQALVPSPTLVDGRTERDFLAFIADYASLINFYDNTNNVSGNWVPFVMKDPVILLAAISKTDDRKMYSLFTRSCNLLKKALVKEQQELNTSPGQEHQELPAKQKTRLEIPDRFNDLFERLTKVFMRIERWTYYMHIGTEGYDLKKYVKRETKETFSVLFWALLTLQETLSNTSAIEGIAPVDYFPFEKWDEKTWKENRGKVPYWETLDLPEDFGMTKGTEQEKHALEVLCLDALVKAAAKIFSFVRTIVHHSHTAYRKMAGETGRYPDTVLLRAFVHLLAVEQEQLNGISGRHLEFYYKSILKQSALPATPDSVFICATTAKNSVYVLPSGTVFNGGTDANSNPVLFASEEVTVLNPASVTAAHTLSHWSDTSGTYFILEDISAPSTLKTDTSGATAAWNTFGGSYNRTPSLGFALASPLLYLAEGTRSIVITLTFQGTVTLPMLADAEFSLSTQKAWLELSTGQYTTGITQPAGSGQTVFTLTITLNPAQPAIETFAANPEGFSAEWPMLMISFNSFSQLAQPPVLQSAGINVSVSGLSTFSLYNDSSLLSTKAPYQPFGPIPEANGNFIIGNSEMFSKPLTDFSFTISWDNIPTTDFGTYYSAYNSYINAYPSQFQVPAAATTPVSSSSAQNPATSINPPASASPTATTATVTKTKSQNWRQRFLSWVKSLFTGSSSSSPAASSSASSLSSSPAEETTTTSLTQVKTETFQFGNDSFEVMFNLFQGTQWNPLTMTSWTGVQPSTASFLFGPPSAASSPVYSGSTFSYSSKTPFASGMIDPSIQNETLTYTDASTYGFLKMQLSYPPYGFGSSLYPAVVSWVAYQNAQKLAGTSTSATTTKNTLLSTTSTTTATTTSTASDLLSSPEPPFAPKVSSLTATYSASVT